MKKELALSYAITLLLMLNASIAFAQTKSQIDLLIANYVEIQHKRLGFSGTVLVASNEAIISYHTAGAASLEWKVPMRKDSKFKIASLTKTFTGLLISMAEKEGTLHYENQLQVYFPQLADEKWKQITVLQLLSHKSGIPPWNGLHDYWTVKSKLALSKEQVLEEIFNMPLLFEPGTQAAYSSPAYYLLAAMSGGGNLYSTASDLLQYCRSLQSGNIWGKDVVKEVFTTSSGKKMNYKDGSLYGKGWYIREKTNELPKVYHSGGSTFGFSSKIVMYPDEKLYIILLANVSFLPMDEVLWKDIEKIVFGKPFQMPQQFAEQVKLAVDQFEKFAGLYTSANKMNLHVFMHQNMLFVKLGPHPPLEIYPKGKNEFFAKKIDIQLVFSQDGEGRITGLQAQGRGRTDHFLKQ